MAKRYEQMRELVARVKPKTIVEVGVHRGMRASRLCQWAVDYQWEVTYTGYDVFDTVDMAYQAEALNGKGAPSQAAAARRLDAIKRLTWSFVIGDTRKTLHGKTVDCDFAFIDGDHRVEAIRGDAAALDCPMMVFDDYYVPGKNGELPDLTLYGANAVVDEYRSQGAKVTILPIKDGCDHKAYSVLAVVER